jgi:hypothetical protein
MSLRNWILKKIAERKGNQMLDKLRNAVSGYKTYIGAAFAVLILVYGHFWGPASIAGVAIPEVTTAEMWKGIWEALMAVFIRAGIKKQGATA